MKKNLMIFVMALLCPILVFGQSRTTITGTVYDANKESVIGASVYEKGTTNGVTTNVDGEFALQVTNPNATLVISYVGYKTQEIPLAGKNTLKVTLLEDVGMLEEVVVTGYGGTQLRSKVTNSISKVSEETWSIGAHSNPAQALSGAVAGLKVVQSSGNPGATPTIILRGGTNLNGSGSPLIMVDGQIRGSLSDINPEDIESMDVLKDAGATALYGARASNGVILVTTKSGKSGRAEINLKAKLGFNYVNNPHEFVNAHDYLYYMRKAYADAPWSPKGNLTGATPMGTGNVYNSAMRWNVMGKTAENAYLLDKGWEEMIDPLDPNKTILYKNTNPADYNFNNPAITQDYNINMSGGNDKSTYYAGLGYNKSEGIPITSFYERYSFVFNGSYKLTDWLKSTSSFNYNRANWRSMPGSQGSEANYFGRILSVPMTVRYHDEEGNPTLGPGAGDGNQSYQPEKWQVDNQSDKFTMIQSLEAKLWKGLTLKGTVNWYYSEYMYENFTKDYETAPGAYSRTRGSSAQFGRDFSQTYNLLLNYNTTIARDHSLGVMLGTEYYDLKNKGFSASGSGAPTDDFADLNLTDNGEGKRSIDSWHSQYSILSYFGRANYDFQDKYLLSAVFRYDGYSSLLGDNRWGFFPGVSAGWLFGKEAFVAEALPFLSFGKLRSSYGVNGNASGIGAYTLQGSYNSAKYNGNVGYLIGNLPNPALRWEKTRTFEVGLDLSFFQNRLNANFTYYNRLTADKYASLSLPSTTGFSSVTNNNGEFRNRGLEIELSGKIFQTKDFTWEMGGNISYNKNRIISLPDNGLDNNRQGGQQIYTGNGDELKWVGGYQEGQEPGVIVGYVAEGLYQTVNDIPANLIVKSGHWQGKYQYGPAAWAALTDAQKANAIELKPGDMKWKDINGDGIIDSYDQEVLGNTSPHWIGGFNTTLSWKGFSLYGRFDFALGFKNYDNTTPWYLGAMQGTYNVSTEVFDTWSPENPGAKYPRFVYADQLGPANYYRNSTMFAYNGNYLAIRELSLAYSLPKELVNKFRCQRLDLSVTGQNLGYITAAPVAVPETVRSGGTASGTGYPLPRTVLFGINVTF
ncbi:TonB-dependent receptor [Parabacteroides sp. OttesenSCG-928-G06]|nr:TonB-dependent receptor [Parabacteroides sp. OttesenSCG-928-G06]